MVAKEVVDPHTNVLALEISKGIMNMESLSKRKLLELDTLVWG